MNSTFEVPGPAVLTAPCALSIVVPAYNEEDVLPIFHRRLASALEGLEGGWEVIYVNDGSKDGTLRILKELQAADPRAGFASLSRNFGKESAMSAGLKLARGDAVVLIDADLQDPPELIPGMVDAWRQGADMVNMRRKTREGETWFKKFSAHWFYRFINWLSEVPIPEDVGDFRLLSRRAVESLNQLPESNRFMKGLFAWVGYKQVIVEYDRHSRAAGSTKFPYFKLLNFAIEGITGFSVVPLRLASYAGFLTAFSAFVYALFLLVKTLTVGESVKGFPTLILTILILGGLQLMAMGIIGEYLGRLFMESKRRPLYLLDEYLPAVLNTAATPAVTPSATPASTSSIHS
ncbi:MAG: glycosyltransferase family 2 protein [Pseudomonadota bacterium]